MAPIGVDEWVARSGDRREQQRPAWRGWLARLGERVGWWPRLALLRARRRSSSASSGFNVNEQTVAFNSVLYAMLALGLNIAVGWAGPARPRLRRVLRRRRLRLRAVLLARLRQPRGELRRRAPADDRVDPDRRASGSASSGCSSGSWRCASTGDYLAIVTLFVGHGVRRGRSTTSPPACSAATTGSSGSTASTPSAARSGACAATTTSR